MFVFYFIIKVNVLFQINLRYNTNYIIYMKDGIYNVNVNMKDGIYNVNVNMKDGIYNVNFRSIISSA
jgi:hypothetical protein